MLFWLIKKRQQKASLLAAHEQVKFRENRLQLALKGSDSEVWDGSWKGKDSPSGTYFYNMKNQHEGKN